MTPEQAIDQATCLQSLQIQRELRHTQERMLMTEQIVHMLDGQVRRRCERMTDAQLAEFWVSQLLEEAK